MFNKVQNAWKSRFGQDVIITIMGQLIVLVVAFLLNKVLSIKLGIVGYGEFSISKRTASVIAYIMLISMGIAIPKYLATYRQLKDEIKEARVIVSSLIMVVSVSLLLFVLLFIFRYPFAEMLFGKVSYANYGLPISLYAFSITLTTFVFSYYRGVDHYYLYSASQIFVQLITLMVIFVFDQNVITLMYAWGILTNVYAVYILTKVWIQYYPKAMITSLIRDLSPIAKDLAQFCVPRIPGEFVLFSFTIVPLIIINHKGGMENAAFFAAAIAINSTITPLFSFVGVVLLPLVSKSIVSNEFIQAENKIKNLGKIYFILGVLGITFIEVFTPLTVNILFNSSYQPIVPIVRIMIISVLPNAFYLLLRNPIDAVSRIPFNSINLTISFIFLNATVLLSSSNAEYALSFLGTYIILGVLSLKAWSKCKKQVYDTNRSIA